MSHPRGRAHSRDPDDQENESDDEEDFMSVAFLQASTMAKAGGSSKVKANETYSERRRKQLARASEKVRMKSRVEREKEAREAGLRRDLLADDPVSKPVGDGGVDGPSVAPRESAAVRMMKAMGYTAGSSLGKNDAREQSKEPSAEVGSMKSAESQDANAATLRQPLRPDQRWIGSNARRGIGSVSVSRAILAASRKQEEDQSTAEAAGSRDTDAATVDFRQRRAQEHQEAHEAGMLKKARRTCEDIDRKSGLEFSPLWIDADWLTGRSPWPEVGSDMRILLDELEELGDDVDLRNGQGRLKGLQDPVFVELGGSFVPDPSIQENPVAMTDSPDSKERTDEVRRFCSLQPSTRLSITLSHLREAHFYCLYCGCGYDDSVQLHQECPGEEEELHD